MALKEFRPLTPTQRFKSLPAFDEITKWRPEKSLLQPKRKSGGRNNHGRLTSRHIGGGHKKENPKVGFKRRKRRVPAGGIRVRDDSERSGPIALTQNSGRGMQFLIYVRQSGRAGPVLLDS